MKRFSKARLVIDLRKQAESILDERRFQPKDGWVQLCPPNYPEPLAAKIQRAVEYGRYMKLREIANDVEEGRIGV